MAAKKKKLDVPKELTDAVAETNPALREARLQAYVRQAKAREKDVPLGRSIKKVVWGNPAAKLLLGGVAVGGLARTLGGPSVQLGGTFGAPGRWAESLGDFARTPGSSLQTIQKRFPQWMGGDPPAPPPPRL